MFCPNCSTQNDDAAETCIKCEFNLKNPGQLLNQSESSGLSSVAPIGRTGLSILAGYLGLFAIIPIFAPIALIVSIIALQKLKNNPGKLGKGRIIFGLIMGALGTMALFYLFLIKGRLMY